MFQRPCPDCGKNIQYKWNCELRVAQERNSICKSCRTSRANKSRKRNMRGANNPAWKGHEEIPYKWFSKYFERKNKNRRTGTITIKDCWELYIKQGKKCALTGVPIGFDDCGDSRWKGSTASIDRIDSKKEYDIDNIQLVHKDLNLMKNHFNEDYFIKMCCLVAKNRGGSCEVV
jgi:hypothetical protein